MGKNLNLRKTTAQFISESIAIFGNKYDYSNTNYLNAKQKVAIVCKIHGEFLKAPNHHLHGQGCPRCASAHTKETKKKMSETHKKQFKDGSRVAKKPSLEQIKKMQDGIKKMPIDKKKERYSKLSIKLKGVPQPMDKKTGKHKDNVHGKDWHFINKAKGVEIKGRNLNQLIRDNAHLFDSKYLNWNKCSCLAAASLRGLCAKKTDKTRPRGSWLGWMIG